MSEQAEYAQNEQQAEAQVAGLRRLGMLVNHQPHTEFDGILARHIEERTDLERDNALSIEVERTVRIVLCTGGPHCEIRWPERTEPTLACYGWCGSGKYERALTKDEQDGLIAAYGDWDDLIEWAGNA